MAKSGEATAWITQQPFFSELTTEEQNEAGSFSFIWGVYELRVMQVLGKEQTVSLTRSVIQEYTASVHIPSHNLSSEKKYFRDRFFDAHGNPNSTWQGAQFRNGDKAEEIKAILLRDDSSPAQDAEALIRIVARLRNNFFHGFKWAYNLKGQKENFANASSVLIKTMPNV